MSENLTRAGGSRYEAAPPAIMAAIVGALAEASDDEIREAFGLGPWRVVTEAHRTRYGEYFAPRVYREMVKAMRTAQLEGNLSIKGFAKFTRGLMKGELFPVTAYGPCIAADMQQVDVTIAPGDDDYTGGGVSGLLRGDRAAWSAGQGSAINHYFGDWIELSGIPPEVAALTPPGLVLAGARGRIRLMLDYGGLLQVEQSVVSALLVWGERVPGEYASNGAISAWDLRVENGAPPIDGMVNAATWGGWGMYGPYQPVNWIGDLLFLGSCYSAAWVDQWIGARAEGVLASSDVHSMAWGEKTIPAAGWAGCFPRKKWIARTERLGGNGQMVDVWLPVEWVTRAHWFASYGGYFEELKAAGAVVPAELVGDRAGGVRYFSSFAPEFVEAINEVGE